MPDPKSPPKLNVYQLALLEWLCELGEGRRLFAHVSGIRSGPSVLKFCQIDRNEDGLDNLVPWYDKAAITTRFGRASFATEAFVRLGLVDIYQSSYKSEDQARYEKFLSRFQRNRVTDNSRYFVPNEKAFIYWREIGEPAFGAARRARQDHSTRVRRMVVLAGKATISVPVEIPWVVVPTQLRSFTCAYGTATVVRETASRIYVEDVASLCDKSLSNVSKPIFSDGPNFYILPESILIDNATVEDAEARVTADVVYIAKITDVLRDASSALTPCIRGFEEKLKAAANARQIVESLIDSDSDDIVPPPQHHN